MTFNKIIFVIHTLLKPILIPLTALHLILGLVQIPSSTTQARQKPEGASGTLTLDGKVFRFRYVRATKFVNIWDENKYSITIFFTEQPLPTLDDLVSTGRLGKMVEERKTEVFKIDIDQDHKVTSSTVWSVGTMAHHPGYSVQMRSFTDELTEGRVYTKKPVDFLGHKLAFDVTFKTQQVELDLTFSPVSSRTGKPLPPGGGEPGKVYIDHVEAQSASIRETLEEWSKKPPLGVTPEYLANMRKKAEVPTVKVTGGLIEGDRATLDAVIEYAASGEEERARVNLLFYKGQWEVNHEARGDRTKKGGVRKKG